MSTKLDWKTKRDWRRLIDKSSLNESQKAVARLFRVGRFSTNGIILYCDPGDRCLLSEKFLHELQGAINAHFGRHVPFTFDERIFWNGEATPADIRAVSAVSIPSGKW